MVMTQLIGNNLTPYRAHDYRQLFLISFYKKIKNKRAIKHETIWERMVMTKLIEKNLTTYKAHHYKQLFVVPFLKKNQ